ncbi:MAG: amidase [Archangium sp.]|nr:amidase [Archangium sp.]
MDQFVTWDAVETAERLRRREVSAVEVVDAAIARAEKLENLGALVTRSFERAREHAKRELSDAPFAGVPSAIKDLANLEGVKTGFGSAAAGPTPPKKSDPFVKAYEALGFVSLGKSATPELGLTATTEPLHGKPCRNPWDHHRTAGGSSGGAASLVASGIVPIAHGSDGGGSIRVPSACCGLVGLKVTRGRFDMEASRLLPVNIATHGVLTRTVRDTIAFWEALDRAVPSSWPSLKPEAGPRKLKIGIYLEPPDGAAIDPEFKQAALDAGKWCESLGHHVEQIPNPVAVQFIDDFIVYWAFVAWAQSGTMKALAHREFDKAKIDPWTKGLSEYYARQKVRGAQATWRLMTRQSSFLDVFKKYDVMLSPTLGVPPPELGYLTPAQDFETKLTRLRSFVPFTPTYNVTGAPAISLPLSRTASGLPIGVMFGSARGNEKTILELALQLEEAKPWPRLPPSVTA